MRSSTPPARPSSATPSTPDATSQGAAVDAVLDADGATLAGVVVGGGASDTVTTGPMSKPQLSCTHALTAIADRSIA